MAAAAKPAVLLCGVVVVFAKRGERNVSMCVNGAMGSISSKGRFSQNSIAAAHISCTVW